MYRRTLTGVPFAFDEHRPIRRRDGTVTRYGHRVMVNALFAWAWFNSVAPAAPLPHPYGVALQP